MSNPSITADKTPWYQWDTGLTVTVTGGAMDECHFANRKQGTAYVQAVINGVARVPDELLQVAAPIKAYGYVSDGAGGQTYVDQTFDVIARNIPADYTYTKTAQKTIRNAEVARDEAVQAAKDAKASELAADDSAVEASNSAQSAGESASAAATSASNAAKSADDAATSASEANAAAGKAVEDASELLNTYTDNAKTSADNAATSASNAADAASAASGSASSAEQSATDASNAKVAAQTAKDEAATSASNAATSASNAESSATAAAKSASDAAASVDAINIITPTRTSVPPSQENGIAVGEGAVSKGTWSVAFGKYAIAKGSGSAALASQAKATNNFSTAAVNGATTSREREFSVGTPEHTSYLANVTTPSFGSDASTKKYTDDNDAKTLTEAKKYTDDNTSNALVGSVSGKLLHVEDAWPSKPLGLTIAGAYKQDGTPSPENPVPITVIENPTVNATGRNLFDVSEEAITEKYSNGAYTINDGAISFNASNDWGGDFMYFNRVKAGVHRLTFSMKWSGDEVGVNNGAKLLLRLYSEAGDMITLPTEKVFGYGLSGFPAYNSVYKGYPQRSGYTKPISFEFLESAGVAYAVLGVCASSNTEGVPIKIWDVQLEVSDAATSYEPYDGASIPITLPAEHPYLAALPDGTHDEIVVKDGRKVLRCNTQMFTIQSISSAIFGLSDAPNAFFFSVVDITANVDVKNHGVGGYGSTASVLCNKMINGFSPEQIASNKASGVYAIAIGEGEVFYCNTIGMTTSDEAISWFAENTPTILIPMETPVDIDLGPADPIALPETISNVWTDAELTTNMSMTYKRDINVAFDNLVQSVVAAAAGE